MSEGVASIGSSMAFSASKPATFNVAGYEALTFSASGEVVNIGDVGPENAVIKFDTLSDGKTNKRMGATDNGQQALELAYDSDNSAQVILEDAAESKTLVSCKETLSSGDILYYVSYVASSKTQVGGSSDYLRLASSLEVDSFITRDPV